MSVTGGQKSLKLQCQGQAVKTGALRPDISPGGALLIAATSRVAGIKLYDQKS